MSVIVHRRDTNPASYTRAMTTHGPRRPTATERIKMTVLNDDDHAILDHRLIGDRYFFPTYAPPAVGAIQVPVEGGALSCWRGAPADDRPVLVHFHGNGELVHHWQDGPLADAVEAAGWSLFLAEYRSYGTSSGEPRLLSMLDDTPAILDAVGVEPERIAVFGLSSRKRSSSL